MLLPTLACLCIRELATQLGTASTPEQENLLKKLVNHTPPFIVDQVIDTLDLNIDDELAATWIDDENYWRRKCQRQWKTCTIEKHGRSWKQAFFEKTVQEKLESFDAHNDSLSELQRFLAFSRKYIRTIEVHKLPSHIDMDLVFEHLGFGPTSLILKYNPGEIGMEYERTLFGMKLSDSRSLAKIVEYSEVLTSLNISSNLIDDDKTRILCSGLLDNISLTHLDLSKNRISDRGARALAKVLQENNILVNCDISDNFICLDGGQALARSLKINRNLCKLDISLNRLDDIGAMKILEAISSHPSLTHLSLKANNAGDEAAAALCMLIKENTPIRMIDMSSNCFAGHGNAFIKAIQGNTNLRDLGLLSCGLEQNLTATIEELLLQRADCDFNRQALAESIQTTDLNNS